VLTLFARLDALARSSGLAVLLLVASNAIPIVGVLFLGWEVQTLLVLYWIESGVVGLINVLKMARAEGPAEPSQVRFTNVPAVPSGCARAFLIPFFLFHYGLFWVVHGVFVFLLPVFARVGSALPGRDGTIQPGSSLTAEGLLFAAIALFVSHLVSYYLNFIRGGEYQRVSIRSQMAQPYGRVFVLHLTIIFGGSLIFALGQPIALLLLLVVLKTALDLVLHLRSHRDVEAAPGTFG
jgi:uncharacterized membrane protein